MFLSMLIFLFVDKKVKSDKNMDEMFMTGGIHVRNQDRGSFFYFFVLPLFSLILFLLVF